MATIARVQPIDTTVCRFNTLSNAQLHASLTFSSFFLLSDGQGCHDTASAGTTQATFLSLTRYTIQSVAEDLDTWTKTIGVTLWKSSGGHGGGGKQDERDRLRKLCNSGDPTLDAHGSATAADGYIHLRGEWYTTVCRPGDALHLCSLAGSYPTGPAALPLVLESHPPPGSDQRDDRVLVLHPDELLSPTLVSEAVTCPRRAALMHRLGSSGLSSKVAVVGTLRHDLFEACLGERDARTGSAARHVRGILRRRAASLAGCGYTAGREAFGEVMAMLPQVQRWLGTFTSWDAGKTKQAKLTDFGGYQSASTRCPTAVSEKDRAGGLREGSLLLCFFCPISLLIRCESQVLKGVMPHDDTNLSIKGA